MESEIQKETNLSLLFLWEQPGLLSIAAFGQLFLLGLVIQTKITLENAEWTAGSGSFKALLSNPRCFKNEQTNTKQSQSEVVSIVWSWSSSIRKMKMLWKNKSYLQWRNSWKHWHPCSSYLGLQHELGKLLEREAQTSVFKRGFLSAFFSLRW